MTDTLFGFPKLFFEEIRKKPYALFLNKTLAGGFDQLVIREDIKPVFLHKVVELRCGQIVPETVASTFYTEASKVYIKLPKVISLVDSVFIAGGSFSKMFNPEQQKALYGVCFCNHLICEINEKGLAKIEKSFKGEI